MFSPAVEMPVHRWKKGSSDWCSKSPVVAMWRVQVSAKWSGHFPANRGFTPCASRRALVSLSTLVSHLSDLGSTVLARTARCEVDGGWATACAAGSRRAAAAATARVEVRMRVSRDGERPH
jgi:hypothetical protein